jgi:NMD protein affecting ribosome stability and mRNA decay
MVDTGSCFECGKEVDMNSAAADPNGNPLCKDCFNVLVRAGKTLGDANELV